MPTLLLDHGAGFGDMRGLLIPLLVAALAGAALGRAAGAPPCPSKARQGAGGSPAGRPGPLLQTAAAAASDGAATDQPAASPSPSSLAGPLTAASSLGSTEAFSGKDSDGQPAVFAVGVELAGAPLATLPALPAYAACAAACRLNATCSSFMYCGAQVRKP